MLIFLCKWMRGRCTRIHKVKSKRCAFILQDILSIFLNQCFPATFRVSSDRRKQRRKCCLRAPWSPEQGKKGQVTSIPQMLSKTGSKGSVANIWIAPPPSPGLQGTGHIITNAAQGVMMCWEDTVCLKAKH